MHLMKKRRKEEQHKEILEMEKRRGEVFVAWLLRVKYNMKPVSAFYSYLKESVVLVEKCGNIRAMSVKTRLNVR